MKSILLESRIQGKYSSAKMGKSTELMQLLKTGNSDAARKLIAKMKKSGMELSYVQRSS